MKKRRMLALLLAAMICLGQVPITAQAAVSASDAQAYLNALDQTRPENSFLIDFDGDGRDELLAVTSEPAFYVWQGDKVLLDGEALDAYDIALVAVYKKGNQCYLSYGWGNVHWSWWGYSTVQNGKWKTIATGEIAAADDAGYFDDWSYTYKINGKTVTEEEYNKAETEYRNITDGANYQFRVVDVAAGGCDFEYSDVRAQLKEIVEAETRSKVEAMKTAATPDEILAFIPYIGDRSKCKMDAQMAQAYADALRGLGTPEDYYDSYTPENQAVLIDFARTGYPFLLTTLKYDKYRTNDEDFGYGGSVLWGYKDGKAKAYSFEREPGVGDEYPDAYYLLTDILIGTTNCGPAIMARAYEGEGGNDIFGYRMYQARKNDLFLVDNCMGHLDKEIATFLNRYSWKEEQVIGQETNGLGAKLHLSVSPISANIVAAALESYAAVAPKAVYPNLTELESDGENYDAIVRAALEKVDGEIMGVYKLSDDLYVVVVLVGGTQQATLVRGVREKGAPIWLAEAPGELPAEEELGQMAAQAATRPNVSLDYEKLPSLTDSTALGDYLKERLDNMEGLTPNDPAKTELGAFLESAIANQAVTSISGKGNRVTIDGAAVAPLVRQARETRGEMEDLLGERDISLNKPIVLILRLFWENADWSKPCQIELDETLARELQDCSAQLLLGDDRHYLQFTAQQLQDLLRVHGALSVQFSQAEDGVYDIRFLDKDGNVVESISAPVTVGLPAESMTSTVMVSYTGSSDNWGGQYDRNVGTLSFETRFSGRYEVLENDLAVSDIDNLSEESQRAIHFLVSKGFLTLEGDSFRPGDSLTRYDFTQALVGMFFALDRSLTTDFPDVSADSPYYPYVASAQHDGIVNGYSDGTFSGDDPITREQVLALAARTLVDQKGYALPQDVETYLSGFADRQDISAWAEDQVALAVREGVASRGSVLLPKNNITREQAAVVLYRLFLLLYEVRPVALEVPTATEGGSTAVIVGAVTAAAIGGAGIGGGVWAVLKKRRKR